MLVHTDFIEPAELTGFVRAGFEDDQLDENRAFLAQWLPNDYVDDIMYEFAAGGDSVGDVATFRSYDAESPIGSVGGLEQVKGEIPPISRKYRLSEYDRLRQRHSPEPAIRNAIERRATRGSRAISSRLEKARADALITGKVTLDENGLVAVVDFQRQANHTTAPGVLWSTTASSTVLTNLIAWADRYRATNGQPAQTILLPTAAARLAVQSAEVRNAITGSAAGRTRVTLRELNELLVSEGLPELTIYDGTVGGVAVLSTDKLLMLPAPVSPDDGEGSALGRTVWGTTAEALEDVYDLDLDNDEGPGIVAGAYKTTDPVGLWTKVSAIALPILGNPNLSLCADVA